LNPKYFFKIENEYEKNISNASLKQFKQNKLPKMKIVSKKGASLNNLGPGQYHIDFK